MINEDSNDKTEAITSKMPVVVKRLYMASSFEGLKKKSAIDSNKMWKDKPTDYLLQSVDKVYSHALAALDNEEEKDEELVFLYLFRAMELWNIITQTKEYQKDKKYCTLMYGSKITKAMNLLEHYEKRLKKRYIDGTQDNEKNSDLDVFKVSSSVDIRVGTKKNKTVNGVKKPPDSSSNPLLKDANGFWIKTDPPKPNDNDYYGEKKFIQCEELREPAIASFNKVLILDTRPKRDFELSKIQKLHCVNIPGTLITAGLSANKLGALIVDANEKRYWNDRDQYEQVVLLDWFSKEQDVIPSSPLDNLLNILLKWDPDCIYKNRPLVLAGGFEQFLDMYPTLITNPKVDIPQKPLHSPFIHLSDHNIDYPMNELEELISPKPAKPLEPLLPRPTETAISKPSSKPTVDRTTKPEMALERRPSATGGNGNQQEVPVADRTLLPASGEPMVTEEEPEKMPAVESTQPSPKPTTLVYPKEKPREQNTKAVHSQVTPKRSVATPQRPEMPKLGPTPSLGKVADKGDGDTEVSFERLKSLDIASRGSGLKRSASSPNINKMVEDSDSSSSISFGTPMFDRSTKPKPMPYDSPRTTDTIYAAQKGRGLTGLKNLGNLCYMNSIMQCLSNTVVFSRELTQFRSKELSSGRNHIAAEVAQLLRTLWGETRLTSCRALKGRVGTLHNSFSTNEQQDSHEFLTLLVEWLHEDLNQISQSIVLDGAQEPTGERAWGEFRQKNNSIVLDLFYGQLKSTVTCNHCSKQSEKFEVFSILSVPLPTSADKDCKFSLEDCMKLYLSGSQITGWACPSCKVPRDATQKFDITRLPPVLIIHLKRFMTDSIGAGWCRKRMNMVDFPISSLNMQPFTHPNSELRFHNYNLYAVSNHYGNMDSGHYTAYCKNHMLHKWYRFDDTDVNEMSPSDVRTSAAYILFYESVHLNNED